MPPSVGTKGALLSHHIPNSRSTVAPSGSTLSTSRFVFRRSFASTRLRLLATLLFALSLGAGLAAWLDRQGFIALAHDLAPAPFRDGDVVCFLGDSITEDGRFIAYLRAFYLTRFPDRRIRFVNTGTPGDSVGDARRRLDWDVLPHQPTVVSLMFGMNDVRRRYYDPAATLPDLPARRTQALENFHWNMDVLAGQLAPLHPRLIFVTSSPYDETASLDAPSLPGVNRALARTRPLLARLARKYRGDLIDLHAPLTALNADLQSSSPTATLVGPDRIHPGAPGHLLIASHYLLAQNVPSIVSDFALDPSNGEVSRALNGRITLLSSEPGRFAFECEEFALPFPIDDAARAALDWFPLHDRLNRQRLAISLDKSDDATYRLLIDGETIADFSAAELRAGVNLAPLAHTPQSRQARAVLTTLEEYRQLELQLRRLAAVRALLRNAKLDPSDDTAVETFFASHLAAPHNTHLAYFEPLFADYRTLRHTTDVIDAELARLNDILHQLNRPVPHRYELVRLSPDTLSDLTQPKTLTSSVAP